MRDFLGQTDDPKPTAALEYRFARRSAATGASSRVANLWELGGGTQLAELLRVVLMPANLCRSTVGITLDMRRPATCTLPATMPPPSVRPCPLCHAQLAQRRAGDAPLLARRRPKAHSPNNPVPL